MHTLDRRSLVVTASATALLFGAGRKAVADAIAPPVASVRPVTEDLHGTTITDRYRWMETPSDPEWKPYLMGQNAYARSMLAAIPGRDALASKIGDLTGKAVAVTAVQAAGPYIFTQVRPAGANTFKLYVREGLAGRDRLLLDPDQEATTGSHVSLDYWQPSPDGRLVAVGTSPGGSENSILRVLETATGKRRPDVLDRAQNGSPSWLPDSSGFFLNRLREGAKHGDPDHYLNSVAWFHRLDSDPTSDLKVMGAGLDPTLPITPIEFPVVGTQAGTDVVFGVPANGVQNEVDLYISPLAAAVAGRPAWRQVCARANNITSAAIFGSDLYLLSHQNASRFKVLKTPLSNPAIANAVVAIPEGEAVLKSLNPAKDGLYIGAMQGGVGRVIRLAPDGSTRDLALPFKGAIDAIFADPLQDGCWFAMSSWEKPDVIFRGLPDGRVIATDLAPQPPIDVTPYASEEVLVTARDGTKVPLSIIYRKGTPRDGSAPLYLEAYGAYAISIDPAFIPRILPWLDLGGVYAIAHVRGGGELGEAWHKAGQKLTKPNTWRDCIDCASYLIGQKWTSSKKLAVEGTSAGGIMIGRFLTERPDLLAVALVRVGDSNATRFEFMEAGPANIPEFGTINDAEGFKGLLEMDAYQHVKDGTPYPAVMLTTGLTDPRVANWEAGKFAARLQKATSSGKPIILRVETDAGHGLGSTRQQRDLETADTYAFILAQTGDPRFQTR